MSNSEKKYLTSLHHSFDVGLAEEYGIEEAILIHHFQHWITLNNRKGKNLINGKTWSFQALEKIAVHFPYLNRVKVKHTLNCLVDKGVLVKGNFNKLAIDKTTWFAFVDEDKFISKISNNVYEGQNCPSMAKIVHPLDKIVQAIPDTKKKDTKKKDILVPQAVGGSLIFISIKERVKLTQKQCDELTKTYGKEGFEWMVDKLNTYKITKNQTYNSDFKVMKSWVIGAWKNETNRDKANKEIMETNLKIVKEIQESMERKQKRGILTIDDDQARDTVLGKSCSLYNCNMPQVVAKWYGWEWKD